MPIGNPFFEAIRSAVNVEASDIRGRKEELAEQTDITEQEIEATISETVKRIRSGMYHQEQSAETLPELLSALTYLSGEWGRAAPAVPFNDDADGLESLLYDTAQMAAYDEADKVEYILNLLLR